MALSPQQEQVRPCAAFLCLQVPLSDRFIAYLCRQHGCHSHQESASTWVAVLMSVSPKHTVAGKRGAQCALSGCAERVTADQSARPGRPADPQTGCRPHQPVPLCSFLWRCGHCAPGDTPHQQSVLDIQSILDWGSLHAGSFLLFIDPCTCLCSCRLKADAAHNLPAITCRLCGGPAGIVLATQHASGSHPACRLKSDVG